MAIDPKDFETKDMRIERLEREAKAARAELATLRLIVTEKFAGADMYVKPEDAADVAKWAANPGAVRELLRHEPIAAPEQDQQCASCLSWRDQSHLPRCTIAAAWRALGDPRGAQDIERAHEEALREQDGRGVHCRAEVPRAGGLVAECTRPRGHLGACASTSSSARLPMSRAVERAQMIAESDRVLREAGMVSPMERFRLTSESQQAAQLREGAAPGFPRAMRWVLGVDGAEHSVPIGAPIPAGFTLMPPSRPGGLPYLTPDAINRSRLASDARGMAAVEDEARLSDAQSDAWSDFGARAAAALTR